MAVTRPRRPLRPGPPPADRPTPAPVPDAAPDRPVTAGEADLGEPLRVALPDLEALRARGVLGACDLRE